MEKSARKPSTDPVQEKLREEKSAWNKEISSFIDNLIQFKKLMNGHPSKFYMQKGTIKEPLPADPATILGVLISDFQGLANQGSQIIDQQVEYSKNRKKSKPKGTGLSLEQRLSSLNLEIIKEASNPFSRFLSHFRGGWFGKSPEAVLRRRRLSLLKSFLELYKLFNTFQIKILKTDSQSTLEAFAILDKIDDIFALIRKSLESYETPKGEEPQSLTPKKKEEKSIEIMKEIPEDKKEELSGLIEEAMLALYDFNVNEPNISDLDKIFSKRLSTLDNQFKMTEDLNKKLELAPIIIGIYQNLLKDISSKRGERYLKLEDVPPIKKAEIEILAQDALKKWVGKLKHQLSLSDKTSSIRLEVYDFAKEIRQEINQLMNYLEKDLNLVEFRNKLKPLDKNLLQMKNIMKPLIVLLKEQRVDENLQKLLETRRRRELINLYYNK